MTANFVVGLILYMKTFVLLRFFVLPLFENSFAICVLGWPEFSARIIVVAHSIEYQNHQGAYVVVAFHFHRIFFLNDIDSFLFHPVLQNISMWLLIHRYAWTPSSLGGLWLICCATQEKRTDFFHSIILVWFLFPMKSKAKVTDLKYY